MKFKAILPVFVLAFSAPNISQATELTPEQLAEKEAQVEQMMQAEQMAQSQQSLNQEYTIVQPCYRWPQPCA